MHSAIDRALDGFGTGLRLPDLWQREAITALAGGEDVIVSAPTGAGKTFIFESLVTGRRFPSKGGQVVYTVPTRALANEKWREWKRLGWKVGIATGDLAEETEAPVLVATLETQRERFLAGEGPQLLVIDEYQMIGDRQRGLNYELAVALAPATTRLLLLSGSVANPGEVAAWLRRLGRPVRVVETSQRPVPLDEVAVEGLPRNAPPKYANFWHRLALGVLLSQAGPLLIFAPHRRSAEKIAKKIAEVLPDDDPVRLGEKRLEQACSPELSKLLRKRVAFHHSGLTYAERAAIIEPLAKAGQLRVIVATMGLAAGINFSVRSVFVAGTSYQDGPYEREVSPDELLQMFGRAGRRGLDETGFIICGRDSARLSDARPMHLRRHNELDWPTLIRRMDLAARQGQAPLAAARELRDRLFSVQALSLGFRPGGRPDSTEAASPPGGKVGLFDLKPFRHEILNGDGLWESRRTDREDTAPLGETLVRSGERWIGAESDPDFIRPLLPPGTRLARLDEKGSLRRRYGLEIAVATASTRGAYLLTQTARCLAGASSRGEAYSFDEAAHLLPDLFRDHLAPARVTRLVDRGKSLALLAELSELPLAVYRDEAGRPLVDPPSRRFEFEAETHFTDTDSGDSFEPVPGSPAHVWRKLGLIDKDGRPTPRGTIFSLFQGGEGLAIAAALEDLSYPVKEIVVHLANLRAGHRFDLDAIPGIETLIDLGGSERLASACRRAYGPVDYEGYLALGLSPHYGEGAAEVIGLLVGGKLATLTGRGLPLDFGPGDVERALVEWLSLLRHLRNAPDLDETASPRWRDLKAAAHSELIRHGRRAPLSHLPELPVTVLQRPTRHGIAYAGL